MHEHHSAAGRHQQSLRLVLCLTSVFTLVEAAAGWLTGSLALIADAGHMLTDVLGLGIALFSIWLGSKPATPRHSFGYYRAEILAALVNGVALMAVSAFVLVEAYHRLQSPPEILGVPMLMVAAAGLGVNVTGMLLLHRGAAESLNVRGAFLEMASDLLGSLAVVAAGVIILVTGWTYADPLFSAALGLFIIPRTLHLLKEVVSVLLEGTPAHLDLDLIREAMSKVPGIAGVHDLHAWSVTSGYVALSAHVHVESGVDPNQVLSEVNSVLKDRFDIDHTTIQIEHEGYEEGRLHA